MPPDMRRALEHAEDAQLAPYAARAAHARRRHALDDDGRAFDYRTAFQRDRDRIVYSRAFRRLRLKAVAGSMPGYEDHRRNRLSHGLEVAQVARTVARALRLNEDLTEAVALGHDLGSPPFGPAGERALDDALSGRLDGRGGLGLGDLGGFRRGRQGLRVVDVLEKRYDHPGLNLTDDVREGILKCGWPEPSAEPGVEGVRAGLAPGFEVQAVALADRIATALGDLDDALETAVVTVEQVERLRPVAELRRKLGSRWRPRAGRFMKAAAIHRGLTHLLVTGAFLHGAKTLAAWARRHGVESSARFREVRDDAVRGDEIALSEAGARLLAELEWFLESRVHRGRDAERADGRARRVLLGLLAAYHSDPGLVEDHVLLRFKEVAGRPFLRDVPRLEVEAEIARYYRPDPRFARSLADHVAAMTDPYAIAEHARLMDSGAIPIPSVEQLRREETER